MSIFLHELKEKTSLDLTYDYQKEIRYFRYTFNQTSNHTH